MIKWFKRLVFALQMGTAIPFGASPKMVEDDYPRALGLLPFAGILVGVVCVVCGALGFLLKSPLLAAALCAAGNVMITRGFHLDGWSDTLDALGSTKSKAQMLEIMKDSRIGVMGGAGIALNLILRTVLVYELASVSYLLAIAAVMAAPMAAKLSLVTSAWLGKSANADGMGSLYIGKLKASDVLRALIITGGILTGLLGLWGIPAALVAMLPGALCTLYFKRKLGGMTGDTLGYVNELSELLLLFGFFAAKDLFSFVR